MIRFVAAVQSPIPVHSMKLLLQFSYATQVRLLAGTGRHLQETTLLLACLWQPLQLQECWTIVPDSKGTSTCCTCC
jgi:hypothetical protein